MSRNLQIFLFVICLNILGCPHSWGNAGEANRVAPFASYFPDSEIPDPGAFIGRHPSDGSSKSPIDFTNVPTMTVQCGDTLLYPTQPQEVMKTYHFLETGTYSLTRLNGGDSVCLTSGLGLNAKGNHPCLRPDLLKRVAISDTYMDSCGNYYRGFWRVLYQQSNENMGTLLSQGRSVYPGSSPNL